ncbi:DNA polymerase III subunit chi [Sulfurisoma sediminicola]|uniref:DNA polymerase III chi subunit n=1 Tax=Sulfurisoma sediminicola TaxID=1381557 RepID=A0A497XAP5_9PROT|nr:DNA polymerase III subunit chi [Sulfurisoma sediminicola]RLJ63626.1 DNA polymerase III chi subunit [Sulfurisoma sediminicola]
MTKVLFLHGASDRLAAAARWLTEATVTRRTVLVYAPREETAERLDRLLWTQAATSFVAHARADSPLAVESPIVITCDIGALPHDQVLLNLGDEVPPNFARFEELVEVVSGDDEVRLSARERFKFYRERGYAPESRDIGA